MEVRRQFKEIKGLMEGKVKPDYASCVRISTASNKLSSIRRFGHGVGLVLADRAPLGHEARQGGLGLAVGGHGAKIWSRGQGDQTVMVRSYPGTPGRCSSPRGTTSPPARCVHGSSCREATKSLYSWNLQALPVACRDTAVDGEDGISPAEGPNSSSWQCHRGTLQFCLSANPCNACRCRLLLLEKTSHQSGFSLGAEALGGEVGPDGRDAETWLKHR